MRAILDIVLIILDLYVWLLIASAILSWLIAFNVVNTRNQFVASVAEFLYRITEPLLRRYPRIGSRFAEQNGVSMFACENAGLQTRRRTRASRSRP